MTTTMPDARPTRSIRFTEIFGSAFSGDVAAAVATVAIPLLIVEQLHARDGLVGVAVAADDIGWLVAGPVAGVLIDHFGFKRLLLGSEAIRFAAFAVISFLAFVEVLHPAVLISLIVVKSLASVFFLIGAPTLLATAVIDDDLVRANSALTFSQSASLIFGPPLAGALAALGGSDLAFLIASIAYLISFLLLAHVLRGHPWRTPTVDAPSFSLRAQLFQGWRYLRTRSDVMRMVAAGAQFNFALSMQQAVMIVYLLTLPGFTASRVGIALGAAGLGGILAALLADRASRKWGDAKAVFWLVLAGTALGLLVPLTQSFQTIGFLVIGYFGLTVATVVFSAITGAYRQRTIPSDLLGRVTASSRFISWGIAPLGALLGGLLAEIWSPWGGLIVSALLFVGTAFWLVGMRWRVSDETEAPATD